MNITEQAVYPTEPELLRQRVRNLLDRSDAVHIEGEVLSLIVPDANLLSGGATAARIYRLLESLTYDTVIIISPGQSAGIQRMRICGSSEYRTPLGSVVIDDAMRNELCDEDDEIFVADDAQWWPGGVDVQVPFLQEVLSDFSVVPIIMGDETPEDCRELGTAVGEVMSNRNVLVVASVDLVAANERSLKELIRLIEGLADDDLMDFLSGDAVDVKGRSAVLVAVIAARHQRATNARVLAHTLPMDDQPASFGAVIWRAS